MRRLPAPTESPCAHGLTSDVSSSSLTPNPQPATSIAAGFLTAAQIEKDHALQPFDLFVLAGDVAYATVDPPKDEFEAVWDAYGRMIEPFTKYAPFVRFEHRVQAADPAEAQLHAADLRNFLPHSLSRSPSIDDCRRQP